MTAAERAFYKLLADLASEGLFVHHPTASDRLMEAVEALMQERRKSKELA